MPPTYGDALVRVTTRNPEPKDFTVVLKYPDYMTGGDDEYFIDTATAADPGAAARAVQRAAADANLIDDPIDDPTDFAVVAVFEGDHQVLPVE